MTITQIDVDHSRRSLNYFQPVAYGLTADGSRFGYDYLTVSLNAWRDGGGEFTMTLRDWDSDNNPPGLAALHTRAVNLIEMMDRQVAQDLAAAGLTLVNKSGLINPAPTGHVDHYALTDTTRDLGGITRRSVRLRFRTREGEAVPVFLSAMQFAAGEAERIYPEGIHDVT